MDKSSAYFAVIFTSIRTKEDEVGYALMAKEMESLAKLQVGYLGQESARNEIGITVSYWQSLECIHQWKMQSDHLLAQKYGRKKWYQWYKVRICKIERAYEFNPDFAVGFVMKS